jgi:hypothetical protein
MRINYTFVVITTIYHNNYDNYLNLNDFKLNYMLHVTAN